MNNLIFDRTQSDVDYALSVKRNGVYTTDNLRGAYNISDRNRVAGAINYLAAQISDTRICEYNFYAAFKKQKQDWGVYDIIRRGGINKSEDILNALALLNKFLPYSNIDNTAVIPDDLDYMTYQKANALESVIFNLCCAFELILDSWVYCGDGYYMGDFNN